MNKLLLTLKRDYNDPIIVVANNHKDLEDYLRENYDFHEITVRDDSVSIVACAGFTTEYGTLDWIRHV